MLGLFERGGLPVFGDLRVAFAGGGAAHGQIHADLGALAVEVGAQAFLDLFGRVLGDADDVLGRPFGAFGLNDFDELLAGRLAQGALGRAFLGHNDFSADGAFPLSHLTTLLLFLC